MSDQEGQLAPEGVAVGDQASGRPQTEGHERLEDEQAGVIRSQSGLEQERAADERDAPDAAGDQAHAGSCPGSGLERR